MNIKIYTNPNCPYSKKALTFLKRRKLKFEELTLFKEAQNRIDIINKTGMLSTPVIEIDEETIIGFDEPNLKEILKKKKKKKKTKSA
tara:strand:- start:848 stop:1108 length:261 start_codon:yes stop_codon:yes gene_type:complete